MKELFIPVDHPFDSELHKLLRLNRNAVRFEGPANQSFPPLDEFPQLLNVLQGNMSLVGPRPDVLRLDDYEPWHLRRFEVLPGMTGLWQVSGKNRLTHDEMVALDIEYIETRSLRKDLMILARTVFVLLLDRDK